MRAGGASCEELVDGRLGGGQRLVAHIGHARQAGHCGDAGQQHGQARQEDAQHYCATCRQKDRGHILLIDCVLFQSSIISARSIYRSKELNVLHQRYYHPFISGVCDKASQKRGWGGVRWELEGKYKGEKKESMRRRRANRSKKIRRRRRRTIKEEGGFFCKIKARPQQGDLRLPSPCQAKKSVVDSLAIVPPKPLEEEKERRRGEKIGG
ncbi:hypothetical protein PoB_004084500 [Plakobranchus ocellatus]|uniref:Uncharacterized protein n=1 Tax=Plakobranchus ocellatus TaxID=259542 RepID=A0AAV4B5J7_9GAST|nr:hypothetical protein PoB_004084500 [Plakobranchus ocellatus]